MKSRGERMVRVEFNPSGSGHVYLIKEATAKLIDMCDEINPSETATNENIGYLNEVARLVRLAQTAYEEAAMWAVKAATATKE